jgi:hypothetical protein
MELLKELMKDIPRGRLNEGSKTAFPAGYSEGDVVKIDHQKMGKSMGSYGKFNVLKVTPTQLHLTDHNENKTIKFDLKTGRGIGDADHLMIRE